jgi:uncharacterized protein
MRVWVDLSNSPHPLLFEPVARRLAERGHEVVLTARDNAQTVALARERWSEVEVIGGPSPGGRHAKARHIVDRTRALASWAGSRRPDIALSHNSYAQISAARLRTIRAVTAMDFEHQPANHLAFRLAHGVLVPEAYPEGAARRQGARGTKLRRYPGLKETLYLGSWQPDQGVLDYLGIANSRVESLAVARTPPSRAIYHRLDNPIFEACLRHLDASGVTTVVLPRHPEQRAAIERLELDRCIVPSLAIDSRSLLWHADLFLGAGGTMTREAALLGVPTASVFAGEVPAVDRSLEDSGQLVRVQRPEELSKLLAHDGRRPSQKELRAAAEPILAEFVRATEEVASRASGRELRRRARRT